jgi:hypothetical protein
VGVLLAGSAVLIVTATVGTVFYLSVVRGAKGLPAYTAGLPTAALAHPLARRAVYRVVLNGPVDRETPGGSATTAHRWSVHPRGIPDRVLCNGDAVDSVVAADDTAALPLSVPLPPSLFAAHADLPIPPRVLATCPAALTALDHRESLAYDESMVPRALTADVVGCVDRSPEGAALGECDDGAPARVYAVESVSVARLRVRGAMFRVAGCAGSFAAVCFLVGWMSLRRFDQRPRGAAS